MSSQSACTPSDTAYNTSGTTSNPFANLHSNLPRICHIIYLSGQSIRVTERVPEANPNPAVVQKKENGEERDMMMGTSDLSSALGALGQVVAASSQGFAHLMSAASPRAESKSEYDHHQGGGMGSRMNNIDPIKGRVLHLVCGNMFDHVKNIAIADIVMLETDIPADNLPDLNELLAGMKEGSRTLTYLDLRKIWTTSSSTTASVMPFPFRQLEQNKQLSDRFPTSWSVQRGHHFFLWCKDSNTGSNGVDPSSLFYGFRPSASSVKRNGTSTVNTSSSPNPEITLKQLEDELWRRHIATPTGIMMTGGMGLQQLQQQQQQQQQQHRHHPLGHAIVGGRNVQITYGTLRTKHTQFVPLHTYTNTYSESCTVPQGHRQRRVEGSMLHLGYTHPTTPTRHRTDKCKIVSPTRVMPIHHHHHIKIRVVVCPLVFPFVRCCLVIDRVRLEKAVVVLSPERKTEVVEVEEEIVIIAMRMVLVHLK